MQAAEAIAATYLPEASTAQLRGWGSQRRVPHAALKAAGRELNLTRGKPATEQVALSDALLTAVTGRADCLAEDGTDCTNYYGSPQGLVETRRLFAPIMGAPPEQILIGNNSSLALMHDAVVFALLTGARDGGEPWSRSRTPIAFLCPAPGYDRHFSICEQYGIHMIPVRLTGHGPNMTSNGLSPIRRSRACGACRSTQTRPAKPTRRKPWNASHACQPRPTTSACSEIGRASC